MDWNNVAVQAITALTPVLVLVLVWALKLAWSKIPATAIFVVAPILGLMVNFALSWIAGHQSEFSPVMAAALGSLATVLREFLTTVGTKGVNGAVSETKIMF